MIQTLNPHAFDLSDEDQRALLAFGETQRLAKGQRLYGEGESVSRLWFVRSGRVHLTKLSSSGAESLVAFYGPGQSFCVARSSAILSPARLTRPPRSSW